MHLSVARATAILNTEGRLAVSKFLMQTLSNSFIIVMNLRGSRTTSFLGSSQNNILNLSQLSLYSQASSTKSAGSGRGHMSGHGYLTSKRTATMTQSKPENKVLLSQARSRRRQEKATGSQRSLREDDDSASTNSHDGGGELESYLKSFEKPNQTRAKKKASKDKTLLPRGSELDWAKLMESEHAQFDGTPHDEYEFSDHSDSHSDNSAGEFLKKSRKLSNAQDDDADLHAQAQTRVRKTSAISPEIKCIDENSSPNISDLVITDSLNSSSTSSSLSVQVACHPRQAVQSKTRHSEPIGMSRLGDLEKVSDKVEKNGRNGSRPLHKSSVDTKGNNGTRSQEYLSNKSVSVLEEHSVSELSDFKRNILSSINQFEADIDIDNLHEHSDTTSTFEQNIYDVHSLGELGELEHEHSHTVKGEKVDENEAHSSKRSILKSQGSFSTREKSPNRNSPLEKLRPSGFKFSAATTTVKTSPAKKDQDKPATYSSDDFESESIISEVRESMGDSVDEEIIEEEEEQSIDVSYNGEELKVDFSRGVESAAESHDMTEETVKDASSVSDLSVGKDKSEPSYSSFSETEQKNMSGMIHTKSIINFKLSGICVKGCVCVYMYSMCVNVCTCECMCF